MWYPQILNKMTYFLKMNPGEDVSMCEAIEYNKEEIVFVPLNSTVSIRIVETNCKIFL